MPGTRLCPQSQSPGLCLSKIHSSCLLGFSVAHLSNSTPKPPPSRRPGQHRRGLPCPGLFSGPAWVTSIQGLSTGGGTTRMSPASRGAGAEGSGCGGNVECGRAWSLVSAPPSLARPAGPPGAEPALARGRFLWALSRGAVGVTHLEGASEGNLLVPGAPGRPPHRVRSPGKHCSSPGGQQGSKSKGFRDLRLGVEGKATQPSVPPGSQPPAPLGGKDKSPPWAQTSPGRSPVDPALRPWAPIPCGTLSVQPSPTLAVYRTPDVRESGLFNPGHSSQSPLPPSGSQPWQDHGTP